MTPQTGDKKPGPFRRGTLYHLAPWKRLLFYPAAFLLTLYLRSLRFRLSPDNLAAAAGRERPLLFVGWHNQSLLYPEMFRRCRDPANTVCLVSPSRWAAWEDAFYKWLRLRTVRGSSSRRGIAAARELLAAHRQGRDIALSPDGPAGPCYKFRRGPVMLARLTGAPVLLAAARCHCALRLPTWDRHYLPLPFSRVTIRWRLVPGYGALGCACDGEGAARLRKLLLEITEDYLKEGLSWVQSTAERNTPEAVS